MCSLRYEHEFYVQARKRFPKEGKTVKTVAGEERVISNDIFRERVTLRDAEGEMRTIPLAQLLQETAATGSAIIPAVTPRDVSPTPEFVAEEQLPDEGEGDVAILEAEEDEAEEPGSPPTEPRATAPGADPPTPDERRPHRRRGRRGGRRNRGRRDGGSGGTGGAPGGASAS